MPPQLIFGTAGFGMDNSEFQDASSVRAALATVKDLGIRRLDTGARYPPLNPGRSEELIGEVADLSSDFAVDTKVYTDTRKDSSGDLTRENVRKSVEGSLGRLRRPEGEGGGINVLHIHRADPTTPLKEQIQAFNEQIELGHCKAWGVSNVPIPTLARIVALCDEHGWRKPSCYQAEYSIVSRGVETHLLPLLHAHDIRLNAFRSVASGLLTGNLSSGRTDGTRFDPANPLGGAMRRVFGAPALVSAVKSFDEAVRRHGAEPLEVAVRWIVHHSLLREEDGVLLGASKTSQVVQTVELARKGPLSEELLVLVDELWDAVKESRGDII